MIRNRRAMAVGVLAAAATMLLSACGGAGGQVAGSPAGGATGEPVSGGAATILNPSELRSLDPALTGNNTPGGAVIGNALYGMLLIDEPETGEVAPSMATGFTTADEGATFELTLREGLVFSDGTPLDAEAVKVNWDRLRDPATGSVYQSDAALVAETEATGPTTLRVTMTEPVPNYAYSIITTSMNWVASPAALAGGGAAFDANPVGAGPYTLQEWRRQDAMELVRNPDYWDAPRPYLDSLTVRPTTDASQRLNTVVSGGAQVAVESSWQNLQRAEESGLATDVVPLSGGTYLALNNRRAPFDDPRAREAVAAAVDPQAISVSAFDGAAETVDTLFRPVSPLYTDAPASSPDPARAQELFDELAAEGRPVSFTYTATSSTESRAQAESVQAQLNAFPNASMDIQVIDAAEVTGLQNTHDFDATSSSAAFVDPDPRLWTAFHGESRVNMSGIDDPELNAALDQGRVSTDPAERSAAYATVQERLLDQHPLVWLTRFAAGAVTGESVGGLSQYGFGSLRPDTLWVEP